MKGDLISFILGMCAAELIYVFRSSITTWLKNKETAAQAELAKLTNTKTTVTVAPPATPAA